MGFLVKLSLPVLPPPQTCRAVPPEVTALPRETEGVWAQCSEIWSNQETRT